MSKFEIDLEPLQEAGPDDPWRIAIRGDGVAFTRLVRPGVNDPDDFLHAPPAQLGFWLVDNWWRLRWEPVPSGPISPDWRSAHDLASIGGGYVWPRLSVWGEGSRVGLSGRSDPPGVVSPVRYLTDGLVFVPASMFEEVADGFIDRVLELPITDGEVLQGQYLALRAERRDAELSDWRRLEAELGFDPDDAPDELVHAMGHLAAQYGSEGVGEAALAAQGPEAAAVLNKEIAMVRDKGIVCDLREAKEAAGTVSKSPDILPWETAEGAALRVRDSLGVPSGPIRNKRLGEILKVNSDAFRTAGNEPALAYGLRLRGARGATNAVAHRTRWSQGRRFDLCRALGDAIWSDNDALGPLTNTKSARQKFQRAFAQSLLCPFEDLQSYINTQTPTETDVSAAAKYFHVSERVIQSTLTNKHVIRRERFEEMVEAA